jgi:hypothetical protein
MDGMTSWPAAGWLGNERRFWRVCAFLLGAMAVLKGLHWPSTWAATQAQLSYRHGFVKRGLLGTLYASLHGNHYSALTAIFLLELGAFLLLLVLLTRRAGLEERFGSVAPAALFASSYAITYATHLIGYNDLVNASLAMLLLLIRNGRRRFLAALVVVPVALLVHENFLLMFLPVVLLSFAVEMAMSESAARRRAARVEAAVLAAVAVGINLRIAEGAAMTQAQGLRLEREVAAGVDFAVRPDFFNMLSVALPDNLRTMWEVVHGRVWWLSLAISVAVLLPMLAWLAHLISRLLPLAGTRAAWLKAATLAAVGAPLLMHLLGWDVVRWNVWTAFAGYLALLVLTMHMPKGAVPLTAAERNAIVLLLALNMASGHGLFDGVAVQMYPFFPPWLGSWAASF